MILFFLKSYFAHQKNDWCLCLAMASVSNFAAMASSDLSSVFDHLSTKCDTSQGTYSVVLSKSPIFDTTTIRNHPGSAHLTIVKRTHQEAQVRRGVLLLQHADYLVFLVKQALSKKAYIRSAPLISFPLPGPDANTPYFFGFDGKLLSAEQSQDKVTHAWALQGVKERDQPASDPTKLPGGKTSITLANEHLPGHRLSVFFEWQSRELTVVLWSHSEFERYGSLAVPPCLRDDAQRRRTSPVNRSPDGSNSPSWRSGTISVDDWFEQRKRASQRTF